MIPRRLNTIRAYLTVAAFGMWPLVIVGQSSDASPVDLQESITSQADGTGRLMLSVLNKADKNIVGVSIVITDPQKNCKKVRDFVFGMAPGAARQSIGPHQVYTSAVEVPSGATVSASVDYVLFDDDTYWGPDSMHHSRRIEGLRSGSRSSLLFLKLKLDRDGPAAVLDVLRTLQ
jgi:hypothetical protein